VLPGGPNGLTAGPGGVLYVTTTTTDSHPGSIGQVSELTPPAAPGGTWTLTVLHNFDPSHSDDTGNPTSLTPAADGAIYGSAYGYKIHTAGSGDSAAFQLTPPTSPGGQWGYTVLYDFGYTEHLDAPLIMSNGNLYGALTTGTGGSIFELQPPSATGGAWTLNNLYTFTNGQIPSGNLVLGANGIIYGATASAPGQPLSGTVYAITTE
jgi:hypothetical protein